MMERSSGDPPLLLAPGFRFYPTEEELVAFYLRHRLAGTRGADVEQLIPVVDIYGYHPSELRAMAGAASVGDTEQWFFFCPRAQRELHGGRPARTTPSGYWKATGSPSYVYSSSSSSSSPAAVPAADNSSCSSRVIGEKRTMVFYEGRAPTGSKTRWKMNEYKAVVAAGGDDDDASTPPPPPPGAPILLQLRNEFSVCRVYISTGTLRSFDRRPPNPPPPASLTFAAAQQAAVHCGYQQPLLLPAAAAAAAAKTASHQHQHQQHMLPTTVVVVADNNNGGRRHAAAESSHNESRSSSGSRGGGVDDGAEEDAAAAGIDWDALIIPPVDDDLGFSGVDDLTRVIWPHNHN